MSPKKELQIKINADNKDVYLLAVNRMLETLTGKLNISVYDIFLIQQIKTLREKIEDHKSKKYLELTGIDKIAIVVSLSLTPEIHAKTILTSIQQHIDPMFSQLATAFIQKYINKKGSF